MTLLKLVHVAKDGSHYRRSALVKVRLRRSSHTRRFCSFTFLVLSLRWGTYAAVPARP